MTAGFGLEKLGLLTLRFPRATILLVLVVLAVSVYGGTRLGFSSDVREIFRSGSADFTNLEEAVRQYPGSIRDILLVVEGPDLFQVDRLESLRNLHLDLALVEGVSNILSVFSARRPPDENGRTDSVFPSELADIRDFAGLERQVRNHPLVSGKLLSEDGNLTIMVVSLAEHQEDVDELRRLVGEIREMAEETLGESGMSVTLTGSAVMRVEIIGALIRDQRTFRIAALTVAVLLCWLFFRSVPYVVIATAPAALSILGLKGGMGFAGQDINILTNVIPGLVLVIAFSSALHLLFAIRRNLAEGGALESAIAQAINEVGPACVLTSATTAIALLSLTVVPHPFIRSFGLIAALGTTFAFVAIMTTVPPLCRLLLRETRDGTTEWGRAAGVHRAIGRVSDGAARLVRNDPMTIAVVGIAIGVGATALHALNTAQYQYQDNLPKGNAAFRAIETVNTKLSGSNVVHLLIQWPEDHELRSTETLDVVGHAHDAMKARRAIKSVSSIHSVEAWFVEGGLKRSDLFAFLEEKNADMTRRFVAPEHDSAIVTGNIASIPASRLLSIIADLERDLEPLRKRYPSARFAVTGLVPVTAKASTEMIGQLNRSLLIAIGVIIVLIGLAFRSGMAGLVSILPNLLPISVAGAGLYLFGKGLQFTSVVAFTIGFGMAVDSTIHVLNRYRVAKEADSDPARAMDATITSIGPVLIVSTLVLICGMGATILSELPMVSLYGKVIATLLATALIGDLLFLPAIIRVVEGWRAGGRGPASGGDLEKSQAAYTR